MCGGRRSDVAATDSDVFHPDAFVGSTHVTPPERTALAGCSRPGSSTSMCPVGTRRPAVHLVEPRHRLLPQSGHAPRPDRRRPGVGRRLDTTWIDHTERGGDRPSDHAA